MARAYCSLVSDETAEEARLDEQELPTIPAAGEQLPEPVRHGLSILAPRSTVPSSKLYATITRPSTHSIAQLKSS